MPNLALILTLLLAFLLASLYALFLALADMGLWLRQEQTWLTVILGVGLTLGCLAVVDFAAAALAALFFAVTGLPIVVESLWRTYRQHRAQQQTLLAGSRSRQDAQ